MGDGSPYDPWVERFHDLMANRVRDVLLVSSDYDAFVLEEDGRLRDRLFVEYSELNLVTMPNLVHVSTANEAMRALGQRRFDLVLTTLRAEDPGVRGLSQRIKSQYPDLPTVLLVLDEIELRRLRAGSLPPGLDHVFLWTGDTRILLAIIKLVEDSLNVAHDTSKTGVQVIIVVEDSIRYYSTFLALLYAELMAHSQSLIAEGLNALHKLLRMRARPKILLATSYEQAEHHFLAYRSHVLAVISDVQFPRGGQVDPEAGYRLAQFVLNERPDLPTLLLSASESGRERASQLHTELVDKNSPGLLRALRKFLTDNLGFGDFVFRLPDYTEVDRASDMYQLADAISRVDARSVEYHAARNHFNVWLRARSMFDLADLVAPAQLSDFAGIEELRQFLLESIRRAADREQGGIVSDFTDIHTGPPRWFVRLGQGSLGGKGRGVAFLHSLLSRHNLETAFPGLLVRVPRTLALATDCFDRFLEGVGEQSEQACLSQPLPEPFLSQLRSAMATLGSGIPLAVRSSSLLEDSQHQSCAGIYETVLVGGSDLPPEERLQRVCQAISQVYASTFSQAARDYLRHTPFTVEDEKMGIVLQEVVGRRFGSRFYPHVSGVAQSWNHYPIGSQLPEEGVAMLALGLGHTIVEGGRSVRFSPGQPGVLMHLNADFLPYAQREFYALDLDGGRIRAYPLAEAESDGSLARVASVYVADDDQMRENLRLAGPRVVTFADILKWESIPLAAALRGLLKHISDGMGCAVEIEFALDLEDPTCPCLYLLQVRPLAEGSVSLEEEGSRSGTALVGKGEITVCRSPRSVGHGAYRDLHDIVMVTAQDPDMLVTPALAQEVAALNGKLVAEGKPYVLIGPGRWGSSDPALGIPVQFTQIVGAAAIIELPFAGRAVEPSLGSHFFHELVSRRIGYLCLPLHEDSWLDREWLLAQAVVEQTEHARRIHLESGLSLYLDGRAGKGLLVRS